MNTFNNITNGVHMSDKRRRSDDFGFGVVAYKDRHNRCFECGEMTTGLHHVIPVVYGGTKQLPMCKLCHRKAHSVGPTSQPEMVKKGLEKARLRGAKFGAPVKVNEEAARTILEFRSEGKSMKAIAKLVGLSVGSVHKVINTPKDGETTYTYISFK